MIKVSVPLALETARLRLRRFRADDLEALAAMLADSEATRYLAFTAEQKTPAGARALLDFLLARYDSEAPVFSLALTDLSTGAYLGYCGFQPVIGESGAEIFYLVLPAHQGCGFALEAVEALLRYIFTRTGLNFAAASVAPGNMLSLRVIEAAGFREDGKGKAADPSASGERRRFIMRREAWLEKQA